MLTTLRACLPLLKLRYVRARYKCVASEPRAGDSSLDTRRFDASVQVGDLVQGGRSTYVWAWRSSRFGRPPSARPVLSPLQYTIHAGGRGGSYCCMVTR